MKLNFTLSLLLALTASSVFSQTFKVEERKVKNEEGIDMLSWTAVLDQDINYCKNSYESFMKSLFQAKTTKVKKNVLLAERVLIPELSATLRMDQRTFFYAETGGTAASFTFSVGHDLHLNHETQSEEFEKAESFTKGFVRYHYKRFYGDKLKIVEQKLKSTESEIVSANKQIEKNINTTAKNTKKEPADVAKTKNDKLQRESDALTENISKMKSEVEKLQEESSKLKDILEEVEKFR
jgi:hypothetical protein